MPFELLFTWYTVAGSFTESGAPRFSQLAQETPVQPPQQVRAGVVGGLSCLPGFVWVQGIQFLHKCMVSASYIEPSLQVLGFCYFFFLNLELFYFLIWEGWVRGQGQGGAQDMQRETHIPQHGVPPTDMGSRNQKLVPLEEQQKVLPTTPSISPVSILLMLWNEFQDSRCTLCEWDTTEVNPAHECN